MGSASSAQESLESIRSLVSGESTIYLPKVSDAKKFSGYLDLSSMSCINTRRQKAATRKMLGPDWNTMNLHVQYNEETFSDTLQLEKILDQAMKSGISRINLNGWGTPVIVHKMLNSVCDTLTQIDLQNNKLDDASVNALYEAFCLYDTVGDTRIYPNNVVVVDVSHNPLINPEKLYNALQEKKDYMTFVKLEAALQSFIKDHGNEKLFLVDKYNDLAMAAYKLKNTPCFASKALKYTEKACELFKKRHTGDIPTPYYHNLVLCHKTCNERSSAEHYMKYLHGQSVDKIIQWKQVPRVQRPVIVLCMDGGGMRGLALIKMIDCISEALGMKLDRTKLDMICGTSTGGLLALGIGVKNMSTIQGRDLYYHIGANVFAYKFGDHTKKLFRSLKEGGRFDTNALQKVITDSLGSEILLKTEQERKQKKEPLVFVSAVISGKQPTSLLLRNYHSKRARDSTCKIYEAARATSAAPFFFSSQPISFVDKTKYEMVDGGVMKNNPTWSAYHEEALDQFGDTRDYIVISLGTGRISPTKAEELLENSNKSGFIPLTSVAMLIQIATDSEEVHRQMETHAKMDPKLSYFRFNPTDLPVEKLHESKKQRLIDMEASTEMYMRTTEIKQLLEKLKALFDLINWNNDVQAV